MIKENLRSFIQGRECLCAGWRYKGQKPADDPVSRFLVEGGLANMWLEGAELTESDMDIQPADGAISVEFLGKSMILKRRVRVADILEAGGYRQNDTSAIRLQQTEAWKLAVDGGLSDSTFNLAHLRVKEVVVWGGARKSIFVLPNSQGDVRVAIEGGCEACLFLLPAGRRCVLVTRGSVERTEFGPDSITCSKGRLELSMNDDTTTSGTIHLEIEGPVRDVVVSGA